MQKLITVLGPLARTSGHDIRGRRGLAWGGTRLQARPPGKTRAQPSVAAPGPG